MTIVNIIFFYSFQSNADEMVLIKKYGFGLERDIKGRPLIYPIENYDECKKKCNHMNYIADVNAQLAMSKKNNRIFANITFTNNSSTTYFFSKHYLPMKVKDGKGDEISHLAAEKHARLRLYEKSVYGVADGTADKKRKAYLPAYTASAAAPQQKAEQRQPHHGDDEKQNVCAVALPQAEGGAFVVDGVEAQEIAYHVDAVSRRALQRAFEYPQLCELIQQNAGKRHSRVHQYE